jgi:hypothetical protein
MRATDDGTLAAARYVLAWILRHGRRDFAKSEAQQHGKRRFPKADDIDAPLNELERRGYIRRKPAESSPSPGRPASPRYEVNPAVLENQNPGKRSRYSENPAESTTEGNLQNIQSAFPESKNANRERVTI